MPDKNDDDRPGTPELFWNVPPYRYWDPDDEPPDPTPNPVEVWLAKHMPMPPPWQVFTMLGLIMIIAALVWL